MSEGLAIVILAAGRATRFGGGKLDREVAGKRLGRWVIDAALTLDSAPPTIVIGDPPPQFALDAAKEESARLLANPHADRGLGTSVALAADHAARAEAGSLLVLLADMPLVSPGTLRALAAARESPAAVRHGDGRAGIPACFPASWFDRLRSLAGERGAAGLLREAGGLRLVDVPPRELCDVDRPADLKSLEEALRARGAG